MQIQDCTLSLAQAAKMKRLHQEGHLTNDVIYSILTEEKTNQREQIRIPKDRLKDYFTPDIPEKKIEEDIITGLKLLQER